MKAGLESASAGTRSLGAKHELLRGSNLNERTGSGLRVCCGLALLAAAGSLNLAGQLVQLWQIWTTDPLRSVGMLIVLASLVLILRVWRQRDWELQGSWWGMLPLALVFSLGVLRQNIDSAWTAGAVTGTFLPHSLYLYLYTSGFVLLFAGTRVWRQAWFPLALLLFAQPVPLISVVVVDHPLQRPAAQVARSFASSIGFPPTNPQLLKLMFTPSFGMFIAPACDGLRGAVTMGYVALVVGYLKRASFLRWAFYVCGAVLLGYLLNLLRLCALVLYYRVAAGSPRMENFAEQADYLIGACLFLAAAILFFWVVLRKEEGKNDRTIQPALPLAAARVQWTRATTAKAAAFAGLALLTAVLVGIHPESVPRVTRFTPDQLDELMPKQIGDYKLERIVAQQQYARTAVETGVYGQPASSEIFLGVWVFARPHNVNDSWENRGQDPRIRRNRVFITAQKRQVSFDTALYSDGITDSLVGNAFCTPSSCLPPEIPGQDNFKLHFNFKAASPAGSGPSGRPISILFRVERPHADEPNDSTFEDLATEAQRFLQGADLPQLSRTFQ